jgi:hypothetical protein
MLTPFLVLVAPLSLIFLPGSWGIVAACCCVIGIFMLEMHRESERLKQEIKAKSLLAQRRSRWASR